MFEFRPRILEAGPSSHLGIVEGIPVTLVHAISPLAAQVDLLRAINDWIERSMDRETTLNHLDDIPTVREAVVV